MRSHEKTGYETVETGEGIKVDCFVKIVALECPRILKFQNPNFFIIDL